MADTPLGKGLIEIGANLAPLEAGLAQAQAKTRAALGGATVGVGGAATGAGPAAASAATSTAMREQAAAIETNARAADNFAKSTANAGEKAEGLGKKITNSTKGWREFSGAITSTVGSFTALFGVIGLITTGISYLIEKFRALTVAQENFNKLQQENDKARSEAISKPFVDFRDAQQRQQDQLQEDYKQRVKLIEETRSAEIKAIEEISKQRMQQEDESRARALAYSQGNPAVLAAFEERKRQIQQETDAQILGINTAKQTELDGIKKNLDAANKAIDDQTAEKKKKDLEAMQAASEELRIQTLGPREQIEAQAAMKIKELKKQQADATDADMKKAFDQQISYIEQIKNANLQRFDEQKKKENEAISDTAKAQARAQAQIMEAQRAQFAGLQNQINSLFNTGNMEVGINRVASLVQVLIDKTERR